ncbi:SpoIVB peptidase [Paenibacillus thermotolerans]|uniref:SpoIVB peptidase n=1 Tax=Paenibacillus thermotolerans TaxID=3027807 RepID=UPI002367B592|nr:MULTISPECIES: SpoIVB peptidase [unclassified Paenibacillus]
MRSGIKKRLFGLMLVFIVCLITVSPPFQHFATFPEQLNLFDGQGKQLHLSMPVHAQVSVDNPDIVKVNGSSKPSIDVNLSKPISLRSEQAGQAEMKLKLFGTIPLKTVKVNVVPDLKVIPGGQTIGVKIKSKGVLIVGHHLVSDGKGNKISPGEEAKIKVGDLIVRMNGQPLDDVNKVAAIVQAAGEKKKPIDLVILRGGHEIEAKITPAWDAEDRAYRLGVYIRDSAAGVGTLTFYAPDQKAYGALGHVITDMDTQTPIVVGGGEIVYSNVTSISKSHNGEPGEKRAHFFREDKVLGNIEKNTDFGIFGKMNEAPEYGKENKPIPIAFANEVKEGPAHIYTVVNGQKVEKFNIQIVHVAKQAFPATKGLIIKITDPRLVDKTGGIVQGMSGSPIVQDGKLIGAVTHVFVNDPTSGYGCFIEWMLRDAGILMKSEKANPKAS